MRCVCSARGFDRGITPLMACARHFFATPHRFDQDQNRTNAGPVRLPADAAATGRAAGVSA
jgi:hypothetical protein